jgi:hypothetical protein
MICINKTAASLVAFALPGFRHVHLLPPLKLALLVLQCTVPAPFFQNKNSLSVKLQKIIEKKKRPEVPFIDDFESAE